MFGFGNKIILISFISLLKFLVLINDQDNIKNDLYEDKIFIKWISQVPSIQNDSKDKTTHKSFSKVLFGDKIPEIKKPISIFAISPDSLWIVDQENSVVFEVINGKGIIPFDFKDRQGTLSSLIAIQSISDNEFIFTDSRENRLFKSSRNTGSLKILNDTLKLMQPTGLAYSSIQNEIWVVETAAHRISVLDSNGVLIKRVGKRGNKEGEFNFPTSIWIDKDGYAYVVDGLNYRVQIFDNTGKFISMFGKIGDSTGHLARPKGIATDSHGNIYVVDALFHVVQIFDRTGNFLYHFGSQGQGIGQFWLPSGIFIDDNDYIYVADSYNARIQIFQLTK